MSGGSTWVVVAGEGARTVVGADSVGAVEGAVVEGRFDVETTGSRLSLEVRGCEPVVQAAKASVPTRRQSATTAVQRKDRRLLGRPPSLESRAPMLRSIITNSRADLSSWSPASACVSERRGLVGTIRGSHGRS